MKITLKLNEESNIFSIVSDLSPIWVQNFDILIFDIDFANDQIIDGAIFVMISSIVNELRCLGKQVIRL